MMIEGVTLTFLTQHRMLREYVSRCTTNIWIFADLAAFKSYCFRSEQHRNLLLEILAHFFAIDVNEYISQK